MSIGALELLNMGAGNVGFRQIQLFTDNPSLISHKPEDQWFDRKSVRISPEALANVLVSFANAEGGTLVMGVENDGLVTGVDNFADHVNRLRRAAIDFTSPPVSHSVHLLSCSREDGSHDHVLAMEIPPSSQVHRNNRDETYLRVGDQSRKLGQEAIQELLYDKGNSVFDGLIVPEGKLRDLNWDAVSKFATDLNASAEHQHVLKARGLLVDKDDQLFPSYAAMLLFGESPEAFLPGAFIRILRYDGEDVGLGTRSNLILDVRIGGSLPSQIKQAEDILLDNLRSVTRLSARSGRFETVLELPRFAWLEAAVNAVTHRSYSHQGDHIRVRLFDDRMEVESPGRLPGSVRIDNIRHTRFSRNPRISRVLADLKFVQELNEGVNRMFEEMVLAGLPEPMLQQTESGFKVTLFNSLASGDSGYGTLPVGFDLVMEELTREGQVSVALAIQLTGLAAPTVRRHLSRLATAGIIERVASSATDPRAYWRLRRS